MADKAQTDNPYTLMFGKEPKQMIARKEVSSTIINAFSAENPSLQAFINFKGNNAPLGAI